MKRSGIDRHLRQRIISAFALTVILFVTWCVSQRRTMSQFGMCAGCRHRDGRHERPAKGNEKFDTCAQLRRQEMKHTA
jgi:hypothetical protein